jgi:hypothetical protein
VHADVYSLDDRGVAQPGSARPLGGRGPRFESGRPDWFKRDEPARRLDRRYDKRADIHEAFLTIGALSVNSLIHPAGLPISTSKIKVLRGPVESSQATRISFASEHAG